MSHEGAPPRFPNHVGAHHIALEMLCEECHLARSGDTAPRLKDDVPPNQSVFDGINLRFHNTRVATRAERFTQQ